MDLDQPTSYDKQLNDGAKESENSRQTDHWRTSRISTGCRLADGSKALTDGITTYTDGIAKLSENSAALTDGTKKTGQQEPRLFPAVLLLCRWNKSISRWFRTLTTGINHTDGVAKLSEKQLRLTETATKVS